jgi:hypothetical protein
MSHVTVVELSTNRAMLSFAAGPDNHPLLPEGEVAVLLKSTVETLLPLCSLRAHLANTSRQPALGSPPNKPPGVYSKEKLW